jgi:carbamate kinase
MAEKERKVAVVAIGGNSLIKDKNHQSVEDQYKAAGETAYHIAKMIKSGWDVAIGHGNGPQVGFILRRSELAAHEMHEVPLDVCGADTQGAIGYALQQNLYNFFREMGIDKSVATVVTQVEVSRDDPAWKSPSKPIGSFMDEDMAKKRQVEDNWDVVEDAGRGWRRVVASPLPIRVVELDAVKTLINAGVVTITVGGGGIPVVDDGSGGLKGAAAVIDKDFASSLLATSIDADLFLISTAVEKVAINFGTPEEKWLDHMTLAEAKKYLEEGIHFKKGSMAPKIQAIMWFLENGGREAIITNPENIALALEGKTGTRITRD